MICGPRQGRRTMTINPTQSGGGGLPARALASQSAAQSEAEKTEQQRQVFYVGKHADFGGDPADEREFREEGERAGQKQGGEIPAVRQAGGLGVRGLIRR